MLYFIEEKKYRENHFNAKNIIPLFSIAFIISI